MASIDPGKGTTINDVGGGRGNREKNFGLPSPGKKFGEAIARKKQIQFRIFLRPPFINGRPLKQTFACVKNLEVFLKTSPQSVSFYENIHRAGPS